MSAPCTASLCSAGRSWPQCASWHTITCANINSSHTRTARASRTPASGSSTRFCSRRSSPSSCSHSRVAVVAAAGARNDVDDVAAAEPHSSRGARLGLPRSPPARPRRAPRARALPPRVLLPTARLRSLPLPRRSPSPLSSRQRVRVRIPLPTASESLVISLLQLPQARRRRHYHHDYLQTGLPQSRRQPPRRHALLRRSLLTLSSPSASLPTSLKSPEPARRRRSAFLSHWILYLQTLTFLTVSILVHCG